MQEQPALVLTATVPAAPEKIFNKRQAEAVQRLRNEAARRLGAKARRFARYELTAEEHDHGATITLCAFVTR